MTAFVGAIIGFVIILVIIIILRFMGKGSVIASLRGGVPMVDKAGTGKICELINYEENQVTGKVRLQINYFSGGMKQTGFWYDPKTDFYPNLEQVRWEDYMGTIICYKDLETGQKDYRSDEVKHLTEKMKMMMQINKVYKSASSDIINYFEKQKVEKEEEKEAFKHSKALNAIKKLATAGDETLSKDELKGIGMIDE